MAQAARTEYLDDPAGLGREVRRLRRERIRGRPRRRGGEQTLASEERGKGDPAEPATELPQEIAARG